MDEKDIIEIYAMTLKMYQDIIQTQKEEIDRLQAKLDAIEECFCKLKDEFKDGDKS